jgi:manganese-transporting P-type ATPase
MGTAGIVPIAYEETSSKTSGGTATTLFTVAVIKFQDRVFRCGLPSGPSATFSMDVDVSLWQLPETINADPESTSTLEKSSNSQRKLLEPRFRPVQYPIHLPLRWYINQWRGHTNLQSSVVANRLYGYNTTILQLPTFFELLFQQMMAPFFLFQVFCVALWCFDEYWYYSIYTLAALILFESTMSYTRIKSLQRLHDISSRHLHQRVYVRRGGFASPEEQNAEAAWISIPVSELLPGDWITLSVVDHSVNVPADIVLLHGSAVCDEALLTGESVPQLKQPLDATATSKTCTSATEQLLDIQDTTFKESILFGGTVLLVTTASSEAETTNSSTASVPLTHHSPEQGVTGIVLRTGFETAQGNLLRTMAHSSSSADSVHTMDTFVFILLLVSCALGAAIYVLNSCWHDERRNRFRLLNCPWSLVWRLLTVLRL